MDEARALGVGAEDLRWLGPDEARAGRHGRRRLGGTYTPHCAALHPARLARGLARAAEGRGVALYERPPVTAIEPGTTTVRPLVRTPGGDVRADVVVRATEGWTAQLPGERRRWPRCTR